MPCNACKKKKILFILEKEAFVHEGREKFQVPLPLLYMHLKNRKTLVAGMYMGGEVNHR